MLTGRTTASAAELVAAALSEQSRATLIGTRTYGKTAFRVLTGLKTGYYFNQRTFYTPSGKSLEKDGLTPQICTGINNSCISPDSTNSAKDIQIAINLIKRTSAKILVDIKYNNCIVRVKFLCLTLNL